MDIRVSSRIARTDREWLSWALQFAQADLKRWQEREWLNTLKEALAFGASLVESTHAELPLTMCAPIRRYSLSLEQIKTSLRSSQTAFRRFIRRLEQTMHMRLVKTEIPFKGTCRFYMFGGRAEVTYVAREKTIAKQLKVEMLIRLGELVLRTDLSQLRRCLGCQRLFLAAVQERFDTPECRMRHPIRLLNEESGAADASASRPRRRGSPAVRS